VYEGLRGVQHLEDPSVVGISPLSFRESP